jgi:hypothetical protein
MATESSTIYLTTIIIGGLGALSLALGVHLYASGATDIRDIELELKEKISTIQGIESGILVSLAEVTQRVKTLDSIMVNMSKLGELDKELSLLSDRCNTCRERVDRLELALADEQKFCRGTMIPLIEQLRKDVEQYREAKTQKHQPSE